MLQWRPLPWCQCLRLAAPKARNPKSGIFSSYELLPGAGVPLFLYCQPHRSSPLPARPLPLPCTWPCGKPGPGASPPPSPPPAPAVRPWLPGHRSAQSVNRAWLHGNAAHQRTHPALPPQPRISEQFPR